MTVSIRLGRVGSVSWWVGLDWVTQNGPMDNSGCQVRGTGTRAPIDFQQSSFFLLFLRAIRSTTAISYSEYLQVFAYHSYWQCSHSVRSRVCERHGVRPSVRLSVCRSAGALQQTRCCRFAAVGPACRGYRSIAAPTCGGRMREVPRVIVRSSWTQTF